MKPEQASKVKMRMPTRQRNGEGSTGGEAIDVRTHLIRRGNGRGMLETGDAGNGGDPFRRG